MPGWNFSRRRGEWDAMKRSEELLVVLLVAATVLVDLVNVSSPLWILATDWPEPISIVILGSTFGQLALLAFYLTWGKANILIRVVAMLFGAAFWSIPMTAAIGGEFAEMLGVLLLYVGVTAAPAVGARLAGLPIAFVSETDPSSQSDGVGRWQFSIWWMFSFTTAVAVLTAVWRVLDFPWDETVTVLLFLLFVGLAGHVALWAVLYCPRWWLAVLITAVACPVIGAITPLSGLPPDDYAPLALITGIEGAWVAAAVIVVRISRC